MEIAIPPLQELVTRLRREHPRLLASADDFAAVKERTRSDAQVRQWCDRLRERAESMLREPPSAYEIPDGLRLLRTSRRVLDRVYTLGLLHRLDGGPRYAERVWQELAAAAEFPDWNPRHFLDTAEMTHAFAIGYDWLHDTWTEAQRAVLRAAMVEKGLGPAQACYRGEAPYGRWVQARHNWNQVCNGGIGMGALAIGEELPELTGEILHAGLRSLQIPMARFAPDGAWDEGPGYWHYATSYNTVFLAALETALGTDLGLARVPGFADTGLFPIYLTGPLGRTFNYADGSDGTIRAPQMFWFARQFDCPVYAEYQRQVAAPDARDLLWSTVGQAVSLPPGGDKGATEQAGRLHAEGRLESLPHLPLDRYFRGVEVVTLRSAWEDAEALFVGFKGGDNKANHSNLDLGSFVLDAAGVRWALDLGADNYNMPGYFGRLRWTYYRMRAEGHNTLVLNPDAEPDQDPTAAAAITRFESRPERAFAIADLSAAYARHARRVHRGIALLDRKQVLVQDEVEAERPAELWWFLHTAATVDVAGDGKTAVLAQDGARLQARILAPADGLFTVMDAHPLPASPQPEEQSQNEGIRKLAIRLDGVTDTRLAVLLAPLREAETPPSRMPNVSPLNAW